jgi:hypothetical protein
MEKLEELLTADHEVKILRQVRAAYKDAKSRGEAPEAVLEAVESNYDALVRRYSTETWQCPTVRFGRTELQMPIVSLGGMRQQQTWAPPENMTLDNVGKDCQDNFEAIVDRAMALGINHFETARGYGSSELQFGPVIKKFSREKFILQTKVHGLVSHTSHLTLTRLPLTAPLTFAPTTIRLYRWYRRLTPQSSGKP